MDDALQLIEKNDIVGGYSKDYNFLFDTVSGSFARWGENPEDDPQLCEFGPEIVDIEISTVVEHSRDVPPGWLLTTGGCSGGCPGCYKSSSPKALTAHMPVAVATKIFEALPNHTCQVALGILDIDSHPEMLEIMRVARQHGIVPNVTLTGKHLTEDMASKLGEVVGGCAVSVHEHMADENLEAIRLLAKYVSQVNIHLVVYEERTDWLKTILPRIKREVGDLIHAVLFLHYKPVPRQIFSAPSIDSLKNLVIMAENLELSYGFDSCSAGKYLKVVADRDNYDELVQCVEPCESTLFSLYINTFGKAYPCSFAEQGEGVDVVDCSDFVEDVWRADELEEFRKKLLASSCGGDCRQCVIYESVNAQGDCCENS